MYPSGYVDVCVDCLGDILEDSEFNWDIMDKICQYLDIPFELDRFEEYISTQLVAMFIKGNVLFINTYTEKYGVETDKVSDFHNDFVQEFYKIAFA